MMSWNFKLGTLFDLYKVFYPAKYELCSASQCREIIFLGLPSPFLWEVTFPSPQKTAEGVSEKP
jgi:hypothetical protein